jgi:hypothetical protein
VYFRRDALSLAKKGTLLNNPILILLLTDGKPRLHEIQFHPEYHTLAMTTEEFVRISSRNSNRLGYLRQTHDPLHFLPGRRRAPTSDSHSHADPTWHTERRSTAAQKTPPSRGLSRRPNLTSTRSNGMQPLHPPMHAVT